LLAFDVDTTIELQRWTNWLDENDRAALDRMQLQYSRPGFLKRWLVYLPVIWFPLAQPVLESFLKQAEPTSGKLLIKLGATLVSLLSASYLLRSAAVLLVVYLLWLLWFYSSSARQVARQRLSGFAQLRQTQLEPSLEDSVRAPYEHLSTALQELGDRLERERELLEEELASTS
jgi:hypothetical protein